MKKHACILGGHLTALDIAIKIEERGSATATALKLWDAKTFQQLSEHVEL